MSGVDNNEQFPSTSDEDNSNKLISCKKCRGCADTTGVAYNDKGESEKSNSSNKECTFCTNEEIYDDGVDRSNDNSDNYSNDHDVWGDDNGKYNGNLEIDDSLDMGNNLNSNDDLFDKVIGYYEPSKKQEENPEQKKEGVKKEEVKNDPVAVLPKKKKKKNKKPKNPSYEQDEYDMGYDDTYDSYYD